MSYCCPNKNENKKNNENSDIHHNSKKASAILVDHCKQYNAEQLEPSHDSSSDDEGEDPGVADSVNDANFVEILDLASDETP